MNNIVKRRNTILVVDDEPQIRKLLRITLTYEGHNVELCENGMQACQRVASVKPDLIILDLGLPDVDGKEVIESIRAWSQIPIIVCSVRNADKEVIEALGKGADDYVIKPFNPNILLARIQANLRKSVNREVGQPRLVNGHISMDLIRHEVSINNKIVFFTPKEYDLLRYFMTHCSKMMTHRQILNEVWGPAHNNDMQYLRVYVKQLRKKIEPDSKNPTYLITEPGIGYRMEMIEESQITEEETVF